jgi:hypothetical protein
VTSGTNGIPHTSITTNAATTAGLKTSPGTFIIGAVTLSDAQSVEDSCSPVDAISTWLGEFEMTPQEGEEREVQKLLKTYTKEQLVVMNRSIEKARCDMFRELEQSKHRQHLINKALGKLYRDAREKGAI